MYLTATWWTYQPKSNIKKIPPAKLWPNSFSFWYFKVTKMKKMGCFRSSKRVTVHFRRRTKKVNSSVIRPPIKKCHKMKYTFHPHFCSKLQGPRPFGPKIAKITKSGQKSQHATRSVIWPRIKKCH